MYLIKSAISLQIPDVQLPIVFCVKISLYLSASHPDRPDSPLVLIAAFLTNFSFMSSKIIG